MAKRNDASNKPHRASSEKALAAALRRLAPLIKRRGARVIRERLPEVALEPAALAAIFESALIGALESNAREGCELWLSARVVGRSCVFELRQEPFEARPRRRASAAFSKCRRLARSARGSLSARVRVDDASRLLLTLPCS